MSRHLSERSVEHVVLERGSVANSWKKERWEGLRLLTPNWQSRLPSYNYSGSEPDGYMSMPEVISFIEGYAAGVAAPVIGETTVRSVQRNDNGYTITTDQGTWFCDCVVLATGACNKPRVPSFAEALPSSILSLTPFDYQGPGELPEGGVLVVGAGASGVQMTEDIRRTGRPVTLCVGEHVRMPRVYRGHDIQWWLDAAGVLDERFDAVTNIVRARHVPSMQLTGSKERSSLDINHLSANDVDIVGRFCGIRDGSAQLSGSLRNVCKLADLKMKRTLHRLDEWASKSGMDAAKSPAESFEPTRVADSPPLALDLKSGAIRAVIWCTGYRPDYSWLDVPVVDRNEQVRHHGGVVDSPGMYMLGGNFMRRRKSSFIHGADDDARELSEHLLSYLRS